MLDLSKITLLTIDGRTYRCTFTTGPDYRIMADGPTGTKGCTFTIELVLSRSGKEIRTERRLSRENLMAYTSSRQAAYRGADYLRTLQRNGYIDPAHDQQLTLDAELF